MSVPTASLTLDAPPSWGMRLLPWAASGLMSLSILLLLALIQRVDYVEPEALPRDLQHITLEPPPPPLPQVQMREPPPPQVLDLEPLATDHSIKIAVAPLRLDLPAPEAAPIPKFDLDAFRPRDHAVSRGVNHVYQYREVDQQPVPIKRIKPNVSYQKLRAKGTQPRVIVSMVVTRGGGTRNITLVETSGSDEVDYKVIEALAGWTFRPALRNGTPVNCLVIQAINIKPPRSTSRFSVSP